MKNVGNIAVGMVLALALLIGYQYWSQSAGVTDKRVKKMTVGGGDDEPIVVAGGSLSVVATSGKFGADGDDQIHRDEGNNETKMYLGGVDLVYFDSATKSPAITSRTYVAQKVKIEMTYCADAAFTQCETTSIETKTDADKGKGIRFKAGKNKPKDDDMLPRGFSHKPPTGYLKDVKLPGDTTPLGCGETSRCTLILHYCPTAGCQ